jgi:amino acid adenylation domain-containing protein
MPPMLDIKPPKQPLVAHRRETAGTAWIDPVEVPLDLDGPEATPFLQPPTNFVERPIHELFEIVAARHPSAFALADGAGKLTYAEVRYAVSRLADEIGMATQPGNAVAVLLANIPASVIGVLACLAAGRCCLVLNAEHPAERSAAILRDAGVHAVIVKDDGGAELSLVPDDVATIVIPSAAGPANAAGAANAGSARSAAGGATASSWCPMGPDEPAIVLYTSGSTGQPKGIVLSQATILARVRNNIVAMHLNTDDRFLSLGALGTTAGLVASIVALVGGAAQFVVSASASGVSSLLALIRNERVTIVWGVPALLRLLFEAGGARDDLISLRLIRTFGDRLPQADLQAWRAVLPNACHVAITYGQTEVTAAQWFVPAAFTSNDAAMPTGYLLPEHQFAVVDEAGTPVRDGEIGELILRSRYVALGTWEHGRCATGRARPDPSAPHLRILPTGDLVRLRADGLLQVIGRRDRQVKIRGQRVEPAEIEDAMRRVFGVADAAIVARRDGDESSLLAFIVAGDPDDAAVLDRVRASIRQSLPNYMQPARVRLVDRLPLLPGGKVDVQALLTTEAATPRELRPVVPAPRGSSGAWRAIARAWGRALARFRRWQRR